MAPASPLRVRVRAPLARFELDVDLALTARRTGIFGPSGAGKSVLLAIIAGLHRPATGEVSCAGEVWQGGRRAVPPEGRGIGYVPQDGLLFPHLSVRENLRFGRARAERPGAGPRLELDEVARLLELDPLLARRVGALSGGERQRVALGRALCSAPRLLLLDEPFGALDLPLRRRMLPLLTRVVAAAEVPLVIVSHDPSELIAMTDEVIALAAGQVVARGAPSAVLTDPDLVGPGGYDNVLVGVVAAADGEVCTVDVRGAQIAARNAHARVGDEVVLSLRAEDVMLARQRPVGLSARNVLAARVERVRGTERQWLTLSLAPGVELVAELTATACQQLELGVGCHVHVVFKATSCRLGVA